MQALVHNLKKKFSPFLIKARVWGNAKKKEKKMKGWENKGLVVGCECTDVSKGGLLMPPTGNKVTALWPLTGPLKK